MTHTTEIQAALAAMHDDNTPCVLLTGGAGVGKSYLVKHYIEKRRERPGLVVCAPTGIAACHIGGSTLHRVFRLPIGFIEPGKLKIYNPELAAKLRLITTLVIDEISMVRADLLDAIDQRLRYAKENSRPFGGVKVILVGDPFQLPPVLTRKERDVFRQHYAGPWFFQAQVFSRLQIDKHELTHVFRQSDQVFVDALNAIRTGTHSQETLNLINECCQYEGILLSSTNAYADQVNQHKLDELPGEDHVYVASKFGINEKRMPAPEELRLKAGAKVVFVANQAGGNTYVNGTLAEVYSLNPLRVMFAGGDIEPLFQHTWETIDYVKQNDVLMKKVVGTFTQYPLKLGYALTIHKSQGQTYERCRVNLGNGAFAHGQTYVALSRATSMAGLGIEGRIRPRDVIVDPLVRQFMQGRPMQALRTPALI